MSIGINYKRLFELDILQEFFLRRKDEEDVFGMDAADFDALVQEAVLKRGYQVSDQLLISPVAETETLLQRLGMRMIPTPLGFYLGIRVNERKEGNVSRYEPFASVPETTELVFRLSPNQRSNFPNFTQLRLDQRLPAIYFFSNQNETDLAFGAAKTFPSLSLPALEEADLPQVEILMGDLASRNARLEEAKSNLPQTDEDWQEVGGENLIHERDRRLLPSVFRYRFLAGDQITRVEHRLFAPDDSLVSESFQQQDTPYQQVQLDLRPRNDEDEVQALAFGNYVLEIEASDGDTQRWLSRREVVIHDEWYDASAWGVLHMRPSSGNAQFDLLDANGMLITEKTDGNVSTLHPRFALRLRSRLSWWRYRKASGFSQQEIDKTDKFLEPATPGPAGEIASLLSKQPHRLSALWREISFPRMIGFGYAKVPLPGPENLVPEPERMYADIYVSEIQPLIK